MKQINLNAKVTAILSKRGAEYYSDRTHNIKRKNDTVTMRIWEMMNIFGPECANGSEFFQNNIFFIDELSVEEKTMTLDEFNSLEPGLYRVWWSTGGFSVAAIGATPGGARWVAPTNWYSAPSSSDIYIKIKEVELITTQELEESKSISEFFEQ